MRVPGLFDAGAARAQAAAQAETLNDLASAVKGLASKIDSAQSPSSGQTAALASGHLDSAAIDAVIEREFELFGNPQIAALAAAKSRSAGGKAAIVHLALASLPCLSCTAHSAGFGQRARYRAQHYIRGALT